MHYLRLSGLIPANKQNEFEQTYRFAIVQIPRACTGYNISKDVLNQDVYHFTSYWESSESLHVFTHSSTFLMIIGAFNTLGKLYENVSGEMSVSDN
jgi:hypothetical protein